jgi:hypothetical protein
MASSRRVVSFPFFHLLRTEHLGGRPARSKPNPEVLPATAAGDSAHRPDVRSLRALRTFGDVELHPLVLF